jgi:hypothetical protein
MATIYIHFEFRCSLNIAASLVTIAYSSQSLIEWLRLLIQ